MYKKSGTSRNVCDNIYICTHSLSTGVMKRVFPILMSMMALLTAMSVKANDGSFKVNGNTLVPLQETDISIAKEVLTITIGDYDTVNYVRYATVDVYYEFFNPGGEKTITMAFEAEAPDTWQREPLNRNGVHPFMKDFTVEMNGAAVKHENAVWKRIMARSRISSGLTLHSGRALVTTSIIRVKSFPVWKMSRSWEPMTCTVRSWTALPILHMVISLRPNSRRARTQAENEK